MIVKENAEMVVNAQQLVYGFVEDVNEENLKWICLNGYGEMANIKIIQQDVAHAETNWRQTRNAYVRQTKPW